MRRGGRREEVVGSDVVREGAAERGGRGVEQRGAQGPRLGGRAGRNKGEVGVRRQRLQAANCSLSSGKTGQQLLDEDAAACSHRQQKRSGDPA